jgi:hypothetical protein
MKLLRIRASGVFTEGNAVIPLEDDGEFGLAVGGVVTSQCQDELACDGGGWGLSGK